MRPENYDNFPYKNENAQPHKLMFIFTGSEPFT